MPNGQNNKGVGEQGGLSWSASAPAATQPLLATQKTSVPAAKAATVPPEKSSYPTAAKYAGVLAGGVVAGVLLSWGGSTVRNPVVATAPENKTAAVSNTVAEKNTLTPTAAGPEVAGTLSLMVPAIQAAGFKVALSKVVVQKPLWAVVYENRSGVAGNALGAHLFFSTTEGGSIELLRTTVAGQTYFVGTSLDNGNRTFSLTSDTPTVGADGKAVLVEFKAQ